MLYYYIICILFFLFALFSEAYHSYINNQAIFFILIINLVGLIGLGKKKEKIEGLRRQYFKSTYIFLVGFVITYFQYYLDVALENYTDRTMLIDPKYSIKAFLVVSVGFNAYLLGNYITTSDNKLFLRKNNFILVKDKVLFYLAVLFLAIYYVTVDKKYLMGGYPVFSKGTVADYTSFLLENTIIAFLIVKSRNVIFQNDFGLNIKEVFVKFSTITVLIVLYLISYVLSGERDSILYLSLSLCLAIIYCSQHKFKLKSVVIAMILAGAFITILGVSRISGSSASISEKLERIAMVSAQNSSKAIENESVFSPTAELSGSGRLVTLAIQSVEIGSGHTYGAFFLMDMFLIVPGLKPLFMKALGFPDYMGSSANYLTNYYFGVEQEYGLGSASVADTYLDFGVIGVLVVFFILGYLCRKIDVTIYSKGVPSDFWFTVFFLFFAYTIFISRSSVMYFMSRSLYVMFFVYLANFFKTKRILK